MTKPIITIKAHNKAVYMEMVKDIATQKNGIYSFILRCDSSKMPGAIVDYAWTDSKTEDIGK